MVCHNQVSFWGESTRQVGYSVDLHFDEEGLLKYFYQAQKEFSESYQLFSRELLESDPYHPWYILKTLEDGNEDTTIVRDPAAGASA